MKKILLFAASMVIAVCLFAQKDQRVNTGQVKGFGKTIKGKAEGKWTFSDDSGSKVAEGSYKNGYRAGEWKFYYPNGKLKAEGTYLEPNAFKIDSLIALQAQHDVAMNSKQANEFSKVTIINNREQGIKTGVWKLYDRSGKTTNTQQFNIGMPPAKE